MSPPDAKRANAPSTASAAHADVESLGYEQARAELLDVVRRLEAGSETLEESLRLWERGEALARQCERWLAGARASVEASLAAGRARSDGPGATTGSTPEGHTGSHHPE